MLVCKGTVVSSEKVDLRSRATMPTNKPVYYMDIGQTPLG